MVTYTYSISADFPNSVVNPGKLEFEIESSAIIQTLEYINTFEDNCDITFTKGLSADEAILDALIAAHDGDGHVYSETLTSERVETFTSTASGFTTVLSLSASPRPGSYRLSWAIIYGIDSGTVNFRMRVQQNNSVTKVEYVEEVPNADPTERIPRSGFFHIDLTYGNFHWDIDCGKEEAGEESWKVFKAFLELRRID